MDTKAITAIAIDGYAARRSLTRAEQEMCANLDLKRARRDFRAGRLAAKVAGSKAVVLFGYGLGRGDGGRVSLGRDYQLARARLLAARATVFSLDVTDADWHTLEFGLREVGADAYRADRSPDSIGEIEDLEVHSVSILEYIAKELSRPDSHVT